MKRLISLLLATGILLSACVGCNGTQSGPGASPTERPGEQDKELNELNLQDIVYEKASYTVDAKSKVRIKLSSKTATTGEAVTASLVCTSAASVQGYLYYVVDWGDGTRSHKGPYQATAGVKMEHVYKTAGTYVASAFAVNLDKNETFGWSKEATITVTGDPVETSYLQKVEAISSGAVSDEYAAKNILDNSNDTVWRSKPIESADQEVWVGCEFDTYYSLKSFEVKFSSQMTTFPSDFAIEFTTDRGETWYSVSKYYYKYKYMRDQYNPNMKYPNAAGATLVFDLDGIAANGIRIVTKSYPASAVGSSFEVAEMRVISDSESLFYTSRGGMFDADLNNMWLTYGTAVTEPTVNGSVEIRNQHDPFRGGSASMIGSNEWLEWDSLQITWIGDEHMRTYLKNQLTSVYLGADGWSDSQNLVWATNSSPLHLNESYGRHYSTNSAFVLAVRNYLLNRNDLDRFLDRKNSQNLTLLERARNAMDYMLTELKGDTGVLTILDPQHDGTTNGTSANYWDSMRGFGYISSYENILFYTALLAMSDIEYSQNNVTEGARYLDLAKKTKEEFNKTFWDETNGRYITSVDINGKRQDFGITFTNFMACAAGLPSEEQAKKIYEWVDGTRVVKGDTSTGKDIYGEFIHSARSNTVNMNFDNDEMIEWAWEFSSQNGGFIFYTTHYDLMGRIRYLGAENAMARMNVILDEFHKQDLLRVGMTGLGGQAENPEYFYTTSVIGEFPESGLVPLTYVNGFLGIQGTVDGLLVAPCLPESMSFAGIREYVYNDKTYSIRVDKAITEPKIEQQGDIWQVSLPMDGSWLIKADNTVQAK